MAKPKPNVTPTIQAELERLNTELVAAWLLLDVAAQYIMDRAAWLAWFAGNVSHDAADAFVAANPPEIVVKLRKTRHGND